MILFTTGRGTPLRGSCPDPKNIHKHALYDRKKNWIDFDAGRLLTSENIDAVNEERDFVLRIASGEVGPKTKRRATGKSLFLKME